MLLFILMLSLGLNLDRISRRGRRILRYPRRCQLDPPNGSVRPYGGFFYSSYQRRFRRI
jgi:hypothetical protein